MLKQLKKILACFAVLLLFFVLGFVTLSAYSIEFDSSHCPTQKELYNYVLEYYRVDKDKHNNKDFYVYDDNFGGLYIDESDYLNIGLLNIDYKLPSTYESNMNYYTVSFSYNYLQKLLNSIEDVMVEFNIIFTVINDQYNYLEIYINNNEIIPLINEYLISKDLYSESAICYNVDESMSFSLTSDVANGGESIFRQVDENRRARGTIGASAINNSTGELGVITNEHVAPLGEEMFYGGHFTAGEFPPMSDDIFLGTSSIVYNNSVIDAAFIPYNDQTDWEISPYGKYNDTTLTNVHLGESSQLIQGKNTVKIGQTTGITDGKITQINGSIPYEGVVMGNLIVFSNETLEGDSGGPLYVEENDKLYLVGLVFGGFVNENGKSVGVACSIFDVMNVLNITPITNDSFETIELSDGTVQLNGINFNPSGEFVIPSSLNGKEVSKIGENAFEGKNLITEIIINNNISEIKDSAFKNCTSLSKITISNDEIDPIELGNNIFEGCMSNINIVVPNDKYAEFKNSSFVQGYKNVIVSNDNTFVTHQLSCETNLSFNTNLESNKQKLYKIDVQCSNTYKFSFSAMSSYNINLYDSNFNIVYSSQSMFQVNLIQGTYYFEIKFNDEDSTGNINTQIESTKLLYIGNNNILNRYFYNIEDYVFTNNSNAGFYKITLNASNSLGIIEYPEGCIKVYADEAKQQMLARLETIFYTLDAETQGDSNNVIVFLEYGQSYYINIDLPSASYSSMYINIERLTNTYDIIESNNAEEHVILNENTTAYGDYIQRVEIHEAGTYTITFTHEGPQSEENLMGQEDPLYLYYAFYKEIYSPAEQFGELEMIFPHIASSWGGTISFTFNLQPGVYYIGYYNKLNNEPMTISITS